MRESYTKMTKAMALAAQAHACIGQNRGSDKEQAREAYEACVSEELAPALSAAFEDALGDLETAEVHSLAFKVLAVLEKGKLIVAKKA